MLYKMYNKRDETKEHFSARISPFLIQKIKDKSKKEGRSVTSVVEEAFLHYFKDDLPGLCKSCKAMNEPTDRFCTRCGKPLVEDAWDDYFKNFEEFWKKDEYLEKLKNIVVEHSNKKI